MNSSDEHGGARQMTEEMLSAYLDGELSQPERALVEIAVTDDPQWAATLADIGAVRSALRRLPLHGAPPGVWERIVDKVSREPASHDTATGEADPATAARTVEVPTARWHSRTARWVVAGTAAAAALALFVVPGRDTPDPTNPQLEELADSAAARQSLSSDPVSELVPVGVRAGLGP